MWRSPHARISGPSFNRKKTLSAVSDRKNARDARPEMPFATPVSRVSNEVVVAEPASSVACAALFESTPRMPEPAGDLVLTIGEMAADVIALANDPSHDHRDHGHSQGDERQQQQCRAEPSEESGVARARRPPEHRLRRRPTRPAPAARSCR